MSRTLGTILLDAPLGIEIEDLRKQGAAYLKRSNRIPMAVLGYLTPKEKREELEIA